MAVRKKKTWTDYLTWSNAGLFLIMPILFYFAFGLLTGRMKSETAAAGIITWSGVGTGLALMIQQFKKKPDAE
jgi:hypothetical protein